MSHYTKIETEFSPQHLDCLGDALAEVFGAPKEKVIRVKHEVIDWSGRKRDAVLSISREHCGLKYCDPAAFVDDGRVFVYVDYGDPKMRALGADAFMGRLRQRYARAVAVKEAPRGYRMEEAIAQDGSVMLRFYQ